MVSASIKRQGLEPYPFLCSFVFFLHHHMSKHKKMKKHKGLIQKEKTTTAKKHLESLEG